MQLVHVHLSFPGTTEEAFRYYEKVFGTRILGMATYGDTPFAPKVPESFKKKIIHAQVPITETIHLMGCDSGDGCGPARRRRTARSPRSATQGRFGCRWATRRGARTSACAPTSSTSSGW